MILLKAIQRRKFFSLVTATESFQNFFKVSENWETEENKAFSFTQVTKNVRGVGSEEGTQILCLNSLIVLRLPL